MTYEELNEMVKDWQNVGNLRVATENGNTSLHSDTGITPTVARNIIVSVWNELPRLFEEVRVLVDDHERMSAFLRVIQQISTDSMRCTSRMMRIADWRQGLSLIHIWVKGCFAIRPTGESCRSGSRKRTTRPRRARLW